MENIYLMGTIGSFVSVLTIGYCWYKINKLSKQLKLSKEDNVKLKEKVEKSEKMLSIDETTKYMQFFDKLLMDKLNFYFFNHFLATYEKGKDVNKELIKDIKTQFYIDVSSALCMDQKRQLLKIFTEKSIELYIHQYFLQKLNELDVKFKGGKSKEKETELSANLMKEIYKG